VFVRISRPTFVRFLRQQIIYLAIAAVVAAVFWAIGRPINPATVVLYALLFGNTVTPVMMWLSPHYEPRAFPYNWLMFLLFTLLLVIPAYVLASIVVAWIAPPTPQTAWHLIRTGWKFPVLVLVVFSVVEYAYRTSRQRLEKRNSELQKTVEAGTVQLDAQKQELQRAREIQESLLPKSIPQIPGFEISAAWRPAREVSGDYFDVFTLGDKKLGICIADVVGKGVSAALLMANVQAAVRAFASETESPAAVCAKVNRLLCENLATGKFVTCVFGVLDCVALTLDWCNAGHLEPMLVSHGAVRSLDGGGAVLGVFPEWTYRDERVMLRDGDRLLLFTDGITEAAGANAIEFGEEGVARCALEVGDGTAEAMNRGVLGAVERFCEAHFEDDATLLVIAAR
jgi:sigma-B regulation protein RsbU (phosphoserine phosphatase)